MKNEKRHELETNALAKRLADSINAVKPYSNYLFGAVGVLLGLMLVNSLWSTRSAGREREAWGAFALAISSSDMEMQGLQRLAADDEHEGTGMREWAYVTWADQQVKLAADSYFFNRESAKERLKSLLGVYEALAEGASDPVVQDRARFGLARVYEMRNELDEARKQYALVSGDFSLLAAEKIETLEKPEVQADALWLAEAKLPVRAPVVGPGNPGTRPDFEAALPEVTGQQPISERTLEEMLGGIGAAAEQERYDETESTETETTEAESMEAEPSEESESEESETAETDSPEEEPSGP